MTLPCLAGSWKVFKVSSSMSPGFLFGHNLSKSKCFQVHPVTWVRSFGFPFINLSKFSMLDQYIGGCMVSIISIKVGY